MFQLTTVSLHKYEYIHMLNIKYSLMVAHYVVCSLVTSFQSTLSLVLVCGMLSDYSYIDYCIVPLTKMKAGTF